MTRMIDQSFWQGPMQVFFSWLRVNMLPEELFDAAQMQAYKERNRLVQIPHMDYDEAHLVVEWLNSLRNGYQIPVLYGKRIVGTYVKDPEEDQPYAGYKHYAYVLEDDEQLPGSEESEGDRGGS